MPDVHGGVHESGGVYDPTIYGTLVLEEFKMQRESIPIFLARERNILACSFLTVVEVLSQRIVNRNITTLQKMSVGILQYSLHKKRRRFFLGWNVAQSTYRSQRGPEKAVGILHYISTRCIITL